MKLKTWLLRVRLRLKLGFWLLALFPWTLATIPTVAALTIMACEEQPNNIQHIERQKAYNQEVAISEYCRYAHLKKVNVGTRQYCWTPCGYGKCEAPCWLYDACQQHNEEIDKYQDELRAKLKR